MAEGAIGKFTRRGFNLCIQIENGDPRFVSGSLFLAHQADAHHLVQTWFAYFADRLGTVMI